jgi:NAD(P)H dehydrogenase (quinone)
MVTFLRSIVTYYSRTGNTEKVAKALAKGMEKAGASVTIKRIEDVGLPNSENTT